MSALRQAFRLSSTAGVRLAPKVAFGLLRMHWRYFALGRGRGLAKQLPMTTPMKVHVDPASGCNYRCFFCPQSDPKALRDAGVKFRVMPLPMFHKLIDDLGKFPKQIDELSLGNYGEPLLNKRLAEMIQYAKRSRCAREVSLITNASLLNHHCADRIVSAGLDKIRISIEALSDEGYKTTTGVDQRFLEIVDNVRGLREAISRQHARTFIYVKIIDIGLSDEQKRLFFETFAPLADSVAIENLAAATPQAADVIAGRPKGMTGVSLSSDRKVCPSPFYSVSVHSNGDVGVCCADWHLKTVVGSIARNSLPEIWNGEAMRGFRLAQLTKSWRALEACAGCEMVKHYPAQEDLDGEASRLVTAFS